MESNNDENQLQKKQKLSKLGTAKSDEILI